MRTKMTSKGQITIPEPLRRRFGLKTGTVLEFDEDAPVLTARRVVSRADMARAAGVLERTLAGKSSQRWLEELRGPAGLPSK
jgi:AbrB family looped-hinge helix DNA binding protein